MTGLSAFDFWHAASCASHYAAFHVVLAVRYGGLRQCASQALGHSSHMSQY
jgi:hypothetical protein